MTNFGSVLVVGGDGWIGQALTAVLGETGFQVWASTRRRSMVGPYRPYLDLADVAGGLDQLPDVDAVVLAAAVARLRDCAEDPAASAAINVAGTLRLGEALARRGAYVLLLSTDKVFDGLIPQRRRDDLTSPRTEYGRQKAEAESGVLRLAGRGAILRLSKVVAPTEPLISSWKSELRAGRRIFPFRDMHLAPVPLDLVCRLVGRLVAARTPGLFQASGREDLGYDELAIRLASSLGVDPSLVHPGSADPAAHPPENRPRHSSLDMSLEAASFGIAQPDADAVIAGLTAEVVATPLKSRLLA